MVAAGIGDVKETTGKDKYLLKYTARFTGQQQVDFCMCTTRTNVLTPRVIIIITTSDDEIHLGMVK
jgi:hypothetical protein